MPPARGQERLRGRRLPGGQEPLRLDGSRGLVTRWMVWHQQRALGRGYWHQQAADVRSDAAAVWHGRAMYPSIEPNQRAYLRGAWEGGLGWVGWARRGSNPHALRRQGLSPLCLPVSPRARQSASVRWVGLAAGSAGRLLGWPSPPPWPPRCFTLSLQCSSSGRLSASPPAAPCG